jgi:hypothetical protein
MAMPPSTATCCLLLLFVIALVKAFTYIDVAKNVLIKGYFWHKLLLGS